MGTTLTGTTPQDTYDSLIKVTDNGPLSGTAKYLSDGLGNDSALALSTTKVGINTSTPDANLHISGDANNRAVLRLASTAANRLAAVAFYGNNVESAVIGYEGGSEIISGGVQGDFIIRNVLAGKDIILDTNGGNVGIGTSSPQATLDARIAGTTSGAVIKVGNVGTGDFGGLAVSDGGAYPVQLYGPSLAFLTGNSAYASATEKVRILAGGGITFNGDTAAANALDDYEEGTWTMGISFGGASVGVTYNNNLGTYTKIGRQVTVNGWVNISAVGSSTGAARITGLPFTVGNTDANYAGVAGAYNKISYANQLQAFAERGTTTILLTELTEAGVETTISNTDFQVGSYAIISLTYFV